MFPKFLNRSLTGRFARRGPIAVFLPLSFRRVFVPIDLQRSSPPLRMDVMDANSDVPLPMNKLSLRLLHEPDAASASTPRFFASPRSLRIANHSYMIPIIWMLTILISFLSRNCFVFPQNCKDDAK